MFHSCQTVKTKEEKEVLEHFAGMVSDVGMYYLASILQQYSVHLGIR